MKNSECIIYLCTKNTKQIIKKDKRGWTQKSSKGITRRMTAEQLLSHLLPPLAGKGKCRVVVKKG
jgi:hypothetical protein